MIEWISKKLTNEYVLVLAKVFADTAGNESSCAKSNVTKILKVRGSGAAGEAPTAGRSAPLRCGAAPVTLLLRTLNPDTFFQRERPRTLFSFMFFCAHWTDDSQENPENTNWD